MAWDSHLIYITQKSQSNYKTIKMEVFISTSTTIMMWVLTVILAVIPWYLLNKLWFKPKRFEKLLISQGLHGDAYKLSLFDNSKQNHMMKLQHEATYKSIGLFKEAAPSIFTPVHQTVHKYGTYILLFIFFKSCSHQYINR